MLKLTEDLLKKEPEALAIEFVKQGKAKITSTQIRKFYDDLVLLQSKVRTGMNFEEKILPLIKMTEAKIAYSVGRGVLAKLFYDRIFPYIERIQTKEDFDNFILFYQAVIAYMKFEEKKAELERGEQKQLNREKQSYQNNYSFNKGGFRR